VELTRFSHEQKEPDAPRQIQHQRNRVPRASEQANDIEQHLGHLSPEPGLAWIGDGGAGGCLDCHGGLAEKGCGEAPTEPDNQEGEDIIERRRAGIGRRRRHGVRPLGARNERGWGLG